MTTDALVLAQWFSPSYPIGAFAYSHGIETAIQSGQISSAAELRDWLDDIILFGSGRNDCILLNAAYASKDINELKTVNDTGLAFAGSSERILEATAQGDAFCKVTSQIWGGEDINLMYSVAVGAAAARLALGSQLTASMYLHSNISNLVSASQRLMGLGQTEAQTIVAGFGQTCEQLAQDYSGSSLEDLNNTAFLSDIAAMQHETLQPRIFRT